jgi:hypothetical protein
MPEPLPCWTLKWAAFSIDALPEASKKADWDVHKKDGARKS